MKFVKLSQSEFEEIRKLYEGVMSQACYGLFFREGMILVSAMHITAAVYVNDLEYGLIDDIREWLDRLAPKGDYRHHQTGEDNGEAHLKNLLLHHQVILPITEGRLDLGPWQQVFYAEFDGQRRKRVIIKVMGE